MDVKEGRRAPDNAHSLSVGNGNEMKSVADKARFLRLKERLGDVFKLLKNFGVPVNLGGAGRLKSGGTADALKRCDRGN